MIGKLISFEFYYRYSQPIILLFLLMLAFQGVWYAVGTYDYYVNDATLMNAPAIVYQCLAPGGMLLIIVVAIITGSSIYKDIEHRTAESFYTLPINEKQFFMGKAFAAYLINVSICLAYPLGMAIIQYTGVGPPDKFGPTPWGQLIHGFVLFSLPNLLFLTGVVIAGVVFFRNLVAGYIGVFICVLFFLVAESTRENTAYVTVIHLLDPFAYTITIDTIREMPVLEKNTGYFPASPVFIANRILWLGLSLLLLFVAYRRFSFKYFIVSPGQKRKTLFDETDAAQPALERTIPVHRIFSTLEYFKKAFRLSLLESKNVVRPVGFILVMVILAIMFFLQNVLWTAEYYITTDSLPLTSLMTWTRLPFGVFLLILLAIWSGELLYKERTVNISQLTDALPVPTWVTFVAKFVAMALVSFLLATVLLICGVLGQVFSGFYDFEWSVYFEHLYGYQFGWVTYLLVIAMGFFFGALTGRRFVGHIFSVAVLIFFIVSAEFGMIEQVRFMYPFTPGVEDYSEMNGFGIMGVAAGYYGLMWALLAVSMLGISVWVWNRGAEQGFLHRISIRNPQLHLIGKCCILALLIGFFALQGHIIENVNATGNFRTVAEENAEAAAYELRHKHVESRPHPKISGLDLSIALFPETRRAEYAAALDLTNTGETPIDTLHLNFKDFVTIESVSVENEALTPISADEEFQQYAYGLPVTLQPHENVVLNIACTLDYIGFSQSDPQAALTFNGTLMDRDIIPVIGYNDGRELTQNRDRGDNGLVKLTSRMAGTDDASALGEDVFSPDAIRHRATIQVSTSAHQTAFASGVQVRTWEEEGRNHYLYRIDEPSPMHWYIGSADYRSYEALSVAGVELTILHDPRHDYNLTHFVNTAKEGIDFIRDNLGAYPYEQLTIAEIPFYEEDDFYASPNAIAISEKHGWTADGTREQDLVYIYYGITRELIKQWVQHNLPIANVQGADMLRVALPDALAMHFIAGKFGKDVVDRRLEKKEDTYKKERGNEPNVEPPLLYADGIDYLEANKGAIELYRLMDELGALPFNRTLAEWVEGNASKPVVFKQLYERFIHQVPEGRQAEIRARFETVGLTYALTRSGD
ncbi:MAG: hypothetical protein OXI19_17140 [Gemmatimonadota bacterium]|nr:hypothetical protein [Gemmatimonadota bacterium]